jgi:hypothetical protein
MPEQLKGARGVLPAPDFLAQAARFQIKIKHPV